jgi:hypothetical protein
MLSCALLHGRTRAGFAPARVLADIQVWHIMDGLASCLQMIHPTHMSCTDSWELKQSFTPKFHLSARRFLIFPIVCNTPNAYTPQ